MTLDPGHCGRTSMLSLLCAMFWDPTYIWRLDFSPPFATLVALLLVLPSPMHPTAYLENVELSMHSCLQVCRFIN